MARAPKSHTRYPRNFGYTSGEGAPSQVEDGQSGDGKRASEDSLMQISLYTFD